MCVLMLIENRLGVTFLTLTTTAFQYLIRFGSGLTISDLHYTIITDDNDNITISIEMK